MSPIIAVPQERPYIVKYVVRRRGLGHYVFDTRTGRVAGPAVPMLLTEQQAHEKADRMNDLLAKGASLGVALRES